MAKSSVLRLLLPASALLLVGVWFRFASQPPSAPAQLVPDAPVSTAESFAPMAVPSEAPGRVGQVPGYSPPPIESASPAEIVALKQAEADHSAAAVAPATYVGIDGKRHAMQYNSPDAGAEQAAREERRQLLMAQLMADPQKFAKAHGLALKEVGWILDGKTDFPDRLFE